MSRTLTYKDREGEVGFELLHRKSLSTPRAGKAGLVEAFPGHSTGCQVVWHLSCWRKH